MVDVESGVVLPRLKYVRVRDPPDLVHSCSSNIGKLALRIEVPFGGGEEEEEGVHLLGGEAKVGGGGGGGGGGWLGWFWPLDGGEGGGGSGGGSGNGSRSGRNGVLGKFGEACIQLLLTVAYQGSFGSVVGTPRHPPHHHVHPSFQSPNPDPRS